MITICKLIITPIILTAMTIETGCTFVGGHSYSTWFLTSRNLCVVTCGFFSFHYSLPHHS